VRVKDDASDDTTRLDRNDVETLIFVLKDFGAVLHSKRLSKKPISHPELRSVKL